MIQNKLHPLHLLVQRIIPLPYFLSDAIFSTWLLFKHSYMRRHELFLNNRLPTHNPLQKKAF